MTEFKGFVVGDRVVLEGRYTLMDHYYSDFSRACTGVIGTVVSVQADSLEVDWGVDMPNAEGRRAGRQQRSFVDASCIRLYVDEPSPEEMAEVMRSLGVED